MKKENLDKLFWKKGEKRKKIRSENKFINLHFYSISATIVSPIGEQRDGVRKDEEQKDKMAGGFAGRGSIG